MHFGGAMYDSALNSADTMRVSIQPRVKKGNFHGEKGIAVRRMIGKRLKYKALIADNGPDAGTRP